ncbi:hypothetical protein NO264_14015 [Gluconacetobacter entanii]|nr:hypothetical protein [Gluconacetobacter entanii]
MEVLKKPSHHKVFFGSKGGVRKDFHEPGAAAMQVMWMTITSARMVKRHIVI